MSFCGKVVLITGAGSGIGAATAKQFAKLGASLCLMGRNLPNLKQVASECQKLNNKEPLIIKADLTNESDTKNLMELTVNHFKGFDVLVNNAGIYKLGNIENTSLAEFDKVLNINVRAVYHLTMLAVPHLIKKKGSIVNVSSIAGQRIFGEHIAYGESKGALNMFTKGLAMELASKGVRVNDVTPAYIDTEILKRAGINAADSDELFTKTAKILHPLGRAGLPEEVAKAICFLASDDASFSTGISLPVDGGVLANGFDGLTQLK